MSPARVAWHGQAALRLTAPWGSLVVLPERGAKIASVRDRSNHEWLAQPAPGDLLAALPGARFVEAEMCGWDEVAPTLRTRGLPDHGEVWSVPWRVVAEAPDAVELEVSGAAVPFTLRRRTSITATGFVLDYSARADTRATELLWMAHPQFRCVPGTALTLAPEERPMIECGPQPDRHVVWPAGDVDPLEGLQPGTGRKLWCVPGTAPTSATVHHPGGRELTLSWTAPVTHLALWIDHSWKSREPVLAVEPSTSFGDDLARASAEGSAVRLTDSDWVTWALRAEVAGDNSVGDAA